MIDFNQISREHALASLGKVDALKGAAVLCLRRFIDKDNIPPLTIYSLDTEKQLDSLEIKELQKIISDCKRVKIVESITAQEINFNE
jgi:hypothetical protein